MPSNKRRAYIRDNYALEEINGSWRAVTHFQGAVFSEITGDTRSRVIRLARAAWGHFNYGDESEEFNKIFPPQSRVLA